MEGAVEVCFSGAGASSSDGIAVRVSLASSKMYCDGVRREGDLGVPRLTVVVLSVKSVCLEGAAVVHDAEEECAIDDEESCHAELTMFECVVDEGCDLWFLKSMKLAAWSALLAAANALGDGGGVEGWCLVQDAEGEPDVSPVLLEGGAHGEHVGEADDVLCGGLERVGERSHL